MNLEDKISKAKAKLFIKYPYFGVLASKIRVVKNDNLQNFKTDGIELQYSDSYIKNLDVSSVEFILANGAMHQILSYKNRKNNRSGWLWQMATDISINSILLENNLKSPDGIVYEDRFRGMYAEEIYEELKNDILKDETKYETDEIEQKYKNNNQTKEELITQEILAQEALSILEDDGIDKDELSITFNRVFKLTSSSKIDWKTQLRGMIDETFRDDYAFMPPSKKLLSYGIYLPSFKSQTFKLVIAIDTSASIDNTLLDNFLSEINFLMGMIQKYEIDILVCDDKVHKHDKFYSGEKIDIELKGGGATDFRPVFEYIDKNIDDVKLLLYFSDLEGIFPKYGGDFKTIWVAPKRKDVVFGDILVL